MFPVACGQHRAARGHVALFLESPRWEGRGGCWMGCGEPGAKLLASEGNTARPRPGDCEGRENGAKRLVPGVHLYSQCAGTRDQLLVQSTDL